jgi:5'-3' exonuclease
MIMPNIDNFYIDLNGVLYRCAKEDDSIFKDILKGKGFDEIFRSIMNYINYIVNHVKPNKRLFIAIDGVAPRAKMNNQRQRRYHSAKANKDLNDFLVNQLDTEPGLVSYKNNSISPGTDFMMTLIEHLKFFVQRKIQEDENWRKIDIIVSGGDVPGEGEHKIMDWLRGWKQGPDFDINESHCVYGNDSDLVFLCLALHLPKMVILREEQNYDHRHVNSATKREFSKEHMELLFINLLREYMLLEYQIHEPKFAHTFDIERIIDDFTLFSFFIGNDFLHKLYCMNTRQGNFDEMITKFKDNMAESDGYLCEDGKVNWHRFLALLKKVVYMEKKMMNTTLDDMKQHVKSLEKGNFNYVIMEGDPEINPLEDLPVEADDDADLNTGHEGTEFVEFNKEEERLIIENEARRGVKTGGAYDQYTNMDQKSGHVQEYVNLFDKLKKESHFIEELTEKLESGNKA